MNNSTCTLQHHQTKPLNKQQDEDQQQEEEEEDALSLCDLALNSGEPEQSNDDSSIKTHRHQRSSSQPSDLFEFSNDLKSDNLSHAEDIIHGGKLIPFKQQSIFDDQILILSRDYNSTNFTRRFCESLPAARSNSYADTKLKRSSRSMDREKLRRNSSLVMKSEASDVHRSSPKGLAKSEASKAGPKPKWYDLIFGSVKFPPEMDLRDMKNRQVRRNPGTMFAAAEGGDGSPAKGMGMSSWGQDLLRVLSCKNHPSSVAVTASIGLVPQL